MEVQGSIKKTGWGIKKKEFPAISKCRQKSERDLTLGRVLRTWLMNEEMAMRQGLFEK